MIGWRATGHNLKIADRSHSMSNAQEFVTAGLEPPPAELDTPKTRTGDAMLTSVIRPGKLRGSVKRDAFGFGQLP